MSSPVKYCTKRRLGLQSDGVWRSGSVFAKNEVYKDSFGQVKIRQMFYSSRSASLTDFFFYLLALKQKIQSLVSEEILHLSESFLISLFSFIEPSSWAFLETPYYFSHFLHAH